MKTHFLKLSSLAAGAALILFSCGKETPAKTYPNEVTLDNWETFVNAPQEVINDLTAREAAVTKYSTANGSDQTAMLKAPCSGPNFGKVTSWNGSGWSGIRNVNVRQANWSANTNSWGNYALCASTTGPVCMRYNTPELNGVSALDLVYISRHIQGIQPFNLNTDNGLRQMVASDVDHNGIINQADINAIRATILQISSLPGNNVTFVPNGDLTASVVGDSYGLAFLQNNCRNNASYHMTRRAIKMGDASGNFSF